MDATVQRQRDLITAGWTLTQYIDPTDGKYYCYIEPSFSDDDVYRRQYRASARTFGGAVFACWDQWHRDGSPEGRPMRQQLVGSLGSTQAVRDWLYSDNPYLHGLKPIEALRNGRIDLVEAAIAAYDEGIYV